MTALQKVQEVYVLAFQKWLCEHCSLKVESAFPWILLYWSCNSHWAVYYHCFRGFLLLFLPLLSSILNCLSIIKAYTIHCWIDANPLGTTVLSIQGLLVHILLGAVIIEPRCKAEYFWQKQAQIPLNSAALWPSMLNLPAVMPASQMSISSIHVCPSTDPALC